MLLSLSVGASGTTAGPQGERSNKGLNSGGLDEDGGDVLTRALKKAIESGDTDLVGCGQDMNAIRFLLRVTLVLYVQAASPMAYLPPCPLQNLSPPLPQVYVVLFHMYKHRSLQEFWTIVSSKTLARNLFIKFCRSRVSWCLFQGKGQHNLHSLYWPPKGFHKEIS